jgi:hypothetical protein
MMSTSDESLRVVIALMESSPVARLWHAAMQAVSGSPAKLIALYLHDERWQRAASLPFTREISTVGGSSSDFTSRRAEQLLATTVSHLQTRIEQLATEAGLSIAFEILPESGQAQALVGRGKNIVIGLSDLVEHPIYAELIQLDLQILLIESEG